MQTFMEQIKERKYIPIEKLLNNNAPLVIYGSGYYAEFYIKELEKYNIKAEAVLVDDEFYKGGMVENIPVINRKKFLESYSENHKVNILVAFFRYTPDKLEDIKFCIKEILYYDFSCVSLFRYTYDYIKEHERNFENVYRLLADHKSKELMVAYVNQRISGSFDYCSDLLVESRYFKNGVLEFTDHEVFVDCGAYTGDSIGDFLEYSGGERVFAFEPDAANFRELEKNCSGLKNTVLINKGAFSEEKHCFFEADKGKSSSIGERGTHQIVCTTLDRELAGENVTFIKMDIQGSEEAALIGAKNILLHHKPKLAICVAHRPQDLFVIIEFLESLNLGYEYYFRMQEARYSDIALIAK